MRNKRLFALLILAAAAAGAALFLPAPKEKELVEEKNVWRPAVQPAGDAFAQLPARETMGRQGGELFSSQSWMAPAAPVAVEVAAPVKPALPLMPYRVAGQVVQDGSTHVILARGDAVLTVREGDTLEGGYRVEAIRPDRVTLLYLPLDARQELLTSSLLTIDHVTPPTASAPPAAPAPRVVAAAAGAGADQPARLRWEGPQRVNAGGTFDVALKLTSAEAVRSAPLQLNYDASVLEAVSVRAGGFFSGGLFSYRLNPGGSIFVGAASKGSTASDAELLVVRFRPLRAASAELKLSSVSLQAPSGRSIAHEQPGAFRTVVVQ